MLRAQGQLKAAQAAFDEDLTISRRLAEQDPSNARWQRELAAAHGRVGAMLRGQGQLAAAQEAFAEDLAISRRLTEQDPSNVYWQHGLALACVRVAQIEADGGKSGTALARYEESFDILSALVERAPGFVGWAEDMKTVEAELTALRSKDCSLARKPRLNSAAIRPRSAVARPALPTVSPAGLYSQPIQRV